MLGATGAPAILAVLYHMLGNKEQSNQMIELLKQPLNLTLQSKSETNELLYGRVGYLYSFLFVNKYFQQDVIPQSMINQLVQRIVSDGRSYSRRTRQKAPLMWYWHDSDYLGAAHGVAGILYLLLDCEVVLKDNVLMSEIERTLEWICSLQFPSGNFPSRGN